MKKEMKEKIMNLAKIIQQMKEPKFECICLVKTINANYHSATA